MPMLIANIATPGSDELADLISRLQAEPAVQDVVLSLTATGDPAARQRGFVQALRRNLETTVEPEPTNLRHAWGDWPHDLFAALDPQTAAIEGLGLAVYAWAEGRHEAISSASHIRDLSYYLAQPVTFPLLEAAAAMQPVVVVELHRSHAFVRKANSAGSVEVARFESTLDERHHKTGTEGMEHAEGREREVIAHYLGEVARSAAASAANARAIVAIGGADLRRRFAEHLNAAIPLGNIEWNPDPQAQPTAAAIATAADEAVAVSQNADISAAIEKPGTLDDWGAICAALRDGQVHELWMAPGDALHRYICNHCGNATAGPDACRACGASPWERLPMPEYIARQAKRSGARLQFATGQAREVLSAGTGIVAVRRF